MLINKGRKGARKSWAEKVKRLLFAVELVAVFMLGFIVFCAGVVSVVLQCHHVIGVFVAIELIRLGVLFIGRVIIIKNMHLILLLLAIAVCEARVCLGLVVIIVRLRGNDLVKHISLNKL